MFHNMYGCYACCGHTFASQTSAGERVRTYTSADACGTFVEHEDGSTIVLKRRERPHLLLDAQKAEKRHVMLADGVTVCPAEGDHAGYCPAPRMHDRSWTLTQPIY
jgi:hypothetical protein